MRIFAHRLELYVMAKWYEKYLSIYGKSFKEVPDEVLDRIKQQLAVMQSSDPLVSVVVIAYNEEKRLAACLWSLSELQTKYPIEILGVNNNSSDCTEEVYKRLGVPYFNESKQSPGYARQCGLDNAKGKYHFCIDADTFYPPRYVDLMMTKLTRPDVFYIFLRWFVMLSCMSSTSNVLNSVYVGWCLLSMPSMPGKLRSVRISDAVRMGHWPCR